MRICPTNYLKSGMVIAKNIYDKNYRLLIKASTSIDGHLIRTIKNKDIPYVFVLDEFSDEVVLNDLVSDKMRLQFLDNFQKDLEKFVRGISPRLRNINERVKSAIDHGGIRAFDFRVYHKFAEEILDDIESLDKEDRYFVYFNSNNDFKSFQLNTAVLSLLIGLKLDFSRSELILLATAAFFHDIGHIFKANFLFEESEKYWEYEDSEQHFSNGYTFLRESKLLTAPEYLPALEHGEFSDGSGKPHGKISDNSKPIRQRVEKDNQIYHFSEIIACVSHYLELCSDFEPYQSFQKVFKKRRSKYNYHVASILGEVIKPFPPGFMVKVGLNNNQKTVDGLIVSTHPQTHLPIIKTENGPNINYLDINRMKNVEIKLII